MTDTWRCDCDHLNPDERTECETCGKPNDDTGVADTGVYGLQDGIGSEEDHVHPDPSAYRYGGW